MYLQGCGLRKANHYKLVFFLAIALKEGETGKSNFGVF